ncbi:tail fiber domain-containing protein [Providencia rettgeri]|uniref:tail fiber domain-containing protein n=1 Tax=Providencia rettgeri TaxID=587 RepID=UPI0023AAD617|nr:tail fiber domain-containing protein [Providencia rettgeri]
MTVSTEISSNEYTGNGVTTDFDYKFRIFKANQLSVITSDSGGDNVVTLRLGTDYTVTGTNKSAGGKVILTKPLANGHKISIARDIPITQETSFRNQSKFLAETHEDAFDYLTMIIQRIWRSLGSLYLKRPNILANWFDAKGYRIANLGKPKRDGDAVDLGTLNDEIEGVNDTILKREKRLLRVDDMDIAALPKASERAGNVLTFDKDGKPIIVAPASGSAIDVLNILSSSQGGDLVGFKHPLYSSVHRTLQSKNEDLLSIQDLGAISGIANPNVDDKIIRIFNDNAGVLIPAGFVYVTAKSIATKAGAKFNIVCPNGKATIMSSGNYTMFTQPGQYKFQDCLFEGIRFVGNGLANASSVFMSASADEWVAKFTTHNCSWSGFHSLWNASWIAVYHYNPIFHAVSDAGYIVNTPIFPTGFSSFNLNKIESPIFLEFRAKNLFNIVGGYNLTIINPWFEKVEVFGDYLFDLKQFFGFKVIDGWFEYFKCKWFVRLNTDGTENTQSDFISFDGLHINNSRADSGFSGMVLETYPQYTDSFTDPKVSFKNITEHNNSRAGWCLLRASDATHDEINRYESFSELANLRLKFGQPPCSNGMTLTRNADNTKNADIKFSIRNLSTNNVMLTPSNYQAIIGRTKSGQYEQSLIFDNVAAVKNGYFAIDGTAMLVWSMDFVRPGRNNAQTCGTSGHVWSGGFTQTAFQVTSDKREKEGITSVTDVILDAWSKVNYVMYKLKDSVASKGEEARVHVGVIAQDIKEAFESSGLNPFELGILCYDKDIDKYSVRYEEMLCLEAAYMRRELQKSKQ